MFRDEDDDLIEEINLVLQVYDFEDILAENDMTIAEALTKLVLGGYIALPEMKPL